ncbi:granzyme B-like [Planococcus citri]|uniref:granzyme B-like n=1 Tax=Planococcus citri TaxID=170843 RepID=UPI0031F7C86E
MNILEWTGFVVCAGCVLLAVVGFFWVKDKFSGKPKDEPPKTEPPKTKPPQTEPPKVYIRTTADEKCDEYNTQICELVDRTRRSIPPTYDSNRIINYHGTASEGDFPHQALILFTKKNDRKITCGGTLISRNFVLTAAQCLHLAGAKPKIEVKLGTVYANSDKDNGKSYGVEKIHVHPSYSEARVLHDIALLKLDKKVDFSQMIRPICLNTKYLGKDHYPKTVALGWGSYTTGYSYSYSSSLKWAQLHIDEDRNSVCGESLKAFGNDAQRLICTFNKDGAVAYQGDFGGPLQISKKGCADENTSFYELLGVFSRYQRLVDDKGSGRYNHFTKVALYVPWIEKIVWS